VAQAAADFLNFKMIDGPEGEESDAPSRGKKSGANEQNPNYAKLKTVVQFFHESEVNLPSFVLYLFLLCLSIIPHN